MCKPTCCSSSSGSGAGAAIAALVGIVIICAIARPIIHAVEDILRIVLVTVSVLAGLAIAALATLALTRLRMGNRHVTKPAESINLHQVPQIMPPGWQAQEIEPGIWACTGPQRQTLTGYGKSAALHRQIQAALDAGKEVIFIDGKTGTWS